MHVYLQSAKQSIVNQNVFDVDDVHSCRQCSYDRHVEAAEWFELFSNLQASFETRKALEFCQNCIWLAWYCKAFPDGFERQHAAAGCVDQTV